MRYFLAAGIVALKIAALASADVITADFHDAAPGRTVEVSQDGGDSYRDVRAGLMNWTKTGGDYSGVSGDFTTFCIELNEHVSNGNGYTYNVVAPDFAPTILGGMGAAKADLMAELYGRFYGALDFGSNTQMAGFQVAIWEIVYDDGLDLDGGSFRVRDTGAFYDFAVARLAALDGTGPRAQLDAFAAEGVQDQVVVPEPASLILIGMGLLALRKR